MRYSYVTFLSLIASNINCLSVVLSTYSLDLFIVVLHVVLCGRGQLQDGKKKKS